MSFLKKIVVTAGPTREPWDPVRFLSNRSSGKMGFAVARQAAELGLDVILVTGPVALATPEGVRRVDVETARDMLAVLKRELVEADVLVMAAAVSDWRPARVHEHKLKKAEMGAALPLVRNPDILQELRETKGHRIHVAFAAETENLFREAHRKLRQKGCDIIVVNDVSASDAGFEVDTNRVTLIDRAETLTHVPLSSKDEVAQTILKRVLQQFDAD